MEVSTFWQWTGICYSEVGAKWWYFLLIILAAILTAKTTGAGNSQSNILVNNISVGCIVYIILKTTGTNQHNFKRNPSFLFLRHNKRI